MGFSHSVLPPLAVGYMCERWMGCRELAGKPLKLRSFSQQEPQGVLSLEEQ